MSEESSQKVTEMRPGPSEIRLRPSGGELELVGYLLVQLDEETKTYNSYFVMKPDVPVPLPTEKPGSQACFEAIKAPDDSPEKFYKWVLEYGDIGQEVETRRAEEQYYPWKI